MLMVLVVTCDKFFVYVITGSNGFQRVVVLPIGSVRKATFPYSRFRIFWIFFQIFSSHGADSPFQMRVTFEIFWP